MSEATNKELAKIAGIHYSAAATVLDDDWLPRIRFSGLRAVFRAGAASQPTATEVSEQPATGSHLWLAAELARKADSAEEEPDKVATLMRHAAQTYSDLWRAYSKLLAATAPVQVVPETLELDPAEESYDNGWNAALDDLREHRLSIDVMSTRVIGQRGYVTVRDILAEMKK